MLRIWLGRYIHTCTVQLATVVLDTEHLLAIHRGGSEAPVPSV